MSTQLIDGVGIFDLTHEDYLANFLRDCESREWSKFMAGYTSKNRNANKALTNHASTFQDFIKGSDRAQEIRRIKEHEDALIQIAKKAHNRKGYETYLNETHLYTLPAAELIERENSDWQTIQRIGPRSYNFSAERKVSDFIAEWKNSEFRPAAEEKLTAIRKAMREAEVSRLQALEDDAWAKATTISTVEAYISSYPKGRYIAAATELLGNLRREKYDQEDKAAYFGANSLLELRAYLKDWPSGSYRLQAEERITLKVKQDLDKRDREAWQACQHLDDFIAYLENWPNGRFRSLAEAACEEMKAERDAAQEQAWRDLPHYAKVSDYERFLRLFPGAEQAKFARERINALGMIDQISAMQDCYLWRPKPRPLDGSLIAGFGNEKRLIVGLSDIVRLNTGDQYTRPWVDFHISHLRNRSWAIGKGLSPYFWPLIAFDDVIDKIGSNEHFGKSSIFVFIASWILCYVMLSEGFSGLSSEYGITAWFVVVFLVLPLALFMGLVVLFYGVLIILVFLPMLARATYEAVLIYLFDKTHILFRRDVEEFDRLVKERSS